MEKYLLNKKKKKNILLKKTLSFLASVSSL